MKTDLNQRMMYRSKCNVIIKGYLVSTRTIFNVLLGANQFKLMSILYACLLFKSNNLSIDFKEKKLIKLFLRLDKPPNQ